MARARNIKPGFFRNADLAELSFECRLLFAGLWILADREGRLEDRPKQIKMEIFPADNLDVDALLDQLAGCNLIVRYTAFSKRYVWVRNFLKHQNPHVKEAASTIPAYDEHGASTVQAPDTPSAGRCDSCSEPVQARLIPDSGFLIPDTGSLKQAAPRAEREEAPAEITPPPAAPLIGADPITVRACELAGLLRQRGAALTATNPEVRKWAEDGVSDAQALQALEVAQQRRTDKGDPSAIPAGYLTPIIRDLRNQLTGGGARASPGVSRQAAMSERNRQAAEQAKASIRAAENQRTIDAIP